MIKPLILVIAIFASYFSIAKPNDNIHASDEWMSSINKYSKEKEYYISKNQKAFKHPIDNIICELILVKTA